MRVPMMATAINSRVARIRTFQSMTLRAAQPPACFLSQFDFLNLARAGHGELVNEEDMTRNFDACNPAPAMSGDLTFGDVLTSHRSNEGHGDLAQACVGNPHDGSRMDAGCPSRKASTSNGSTF